MVGSFLLGCTLWRLYLPVEGAFHMVNSSGDFPGQHIPKLDVVFWTYFKIEQLLNVEYLQSYLKDTALYTFPNHQYRTMLIGEFNYQQYIEKSNEVKIVIPPIFTTGLITLIGSLAYVRYALLSKIVDKILLLTVIFNLLLLMKFISDYPSLCNTDFRYFVPTFPIIAYIIAQGLSSMATYNMLIRYVFNILLGLLAMSEVLFLILITF